MAKTFIKFFDFNQFPEEIQSYLQDYKCELCQGVYCKPYQDSCGHIFCKECCKINEYCPYNPEISLNQTNIIYLNELDNLIDELNINCKFKDKCSWYGLVSNYYKHFELCSIINSNKSDKIYLPKPDQKPLFAIVKVEKVDKPPQLDGKCNYYQTNKASNMSNVSNLERYNSLTSITTKPTSNIKTEELELVTCKFILLGCDKVFPTSEIKTHYIDFIIEHNQMLMNKLSKKIELNKQIDIVLEKILVMENKIDYINKTSY